MMEFFKANPAALMDALPTPPGSDCGSEAGDKNTSKLGSSFLHASTKSTKTKASGLTPGQQHPLGAVRKRKIDDAFTHRSGKYDLQRKNSARSFTSNKSFQSQGSRGGANGFRYKKGQPQNTRVGAESMTSHNLAMSTSAAYGLKDRLSGVRHPTNWRLSSVKSSGGAKPCTAEAMASRRLFNRGASYNNARVNSTTGFSRGPVGGAKLNDDRPDRLLKTHHPHKQGRSANVNRTLPHQRPVDLRKLNNRVSAAPASGKSSFLPNISPSACHLSFSHFSSGHQGGGAARSSFYSANLGSQTGSMLPHA
jgi:hypothetical protein